MKCDSEKTLVYSDGELTTDNLQDFMTHVNQCKECRTNILLEKILRTAPSYLKAREFVEKHYPDLKRMVLQKLQPATITAQ